MLRECPLTAEEAYASGQTVWRKGFLCAIESLGCINDPSHSSVPLSVRARKIGYNRFIIGATLHSHSLEIFSCCCFSITPSDRKSRLKSEVWGFAFRGSFLYNLLCHLLLRRPHIVSCVFVWLFVLYLAGLCKNTWWEGWRNGPRKKPLTLLVHF